jgi:predicted nuclease of predicted toxin-antitoxin system
MTVALYMDHHVARQVTTGIRLRGVDVITAYEDGAQRMSDPALLERATALGRVLVTQDEDLLREGGLRQQQGVPFAGVVYARQRSVSIGKLVIDLELIANIYDPPDVANQVIYLPL